MHIKSFRIDFNLFYQEKLSQSSSKLSNNCFCVMVQKIRRLIFSHFFFYFVWPKKSKDFFFIYKFLLSIFSGKQIWDFFFFIDYKIM